TRRYRLSNAMAYPRDEARSERSRVVRGRPTGYDDSHRRLDPQHTTPEAAMPRQQTSSSLTRRRFLQQSAASSAAFFAAPAVLSARSPNEKLKVVIIGCGGRGAANMNEMLKENIVALCDVSETNLLRAAEKAPHARKFRDFRKLYDTLKDGDFDAVVVSTTEHTHAFATLPALERKKHVYCEKPLTHNLHEARII